MALPNAHAITRWLGLDAPAGAWEITSIEPDGPGHVVLCSDGLWNHAPTDHEFEALMRSSLPGTAIEVARRLTATAVAAGGSDNVTVAVIEVNGPDAWEGVTRA